MLHNPTSWPALVIGLAWLFLLGISVRRLWGGLRSGRVRWGSAEIERSGDPSSFWRYVGVYCIVPMLTIGLAAWAIASSASD
jgi:hypothetical protein